MSSSVSGYTVEDAKDELDVLREVPAKVIDYIDNAASDDVLEFLIRDQQLDVHHEGERGIGQIRRTVLKSPKASLDLKRIVSTRRDSTPDNVLVPDTAYRNALTALRVGKPVVLYGPTGTGKTTFAKQLALEQSIGYTLNTADPSWTAKEIIGGIGPDLSTSTVGERLNYRTELGCVSEAVKKAREYDIDYSVIIDEITRADISQIFGPLYTAIENPHQTLIETDDNEIIELDPRVSIICTMNMSDRTVNELDNAITRRFAMIEIDEHSEENRATLFNGWIDKFLEDISSIDRDRLFELFEQDYRGINDGSRASTRGAIMRFGPMHYRDVTVFLGEALQDDDLYMDNPDEAVGQAFRTYIVPRLLNAAAYPQIEQIQEHYSALDEEFEEYDLALAADLAARQVEEEQRRMGT